MFCLKLFLTFLVGYIGLRSLAGYVAYRVYLLPVFLGLLLPSVSALFCRPLFYSLQGYFVTKMDTVNQIGNQVRH
jgi:hypothetical protein